MEQDRNYESNLRKFAFLQMALLVASALCYGGAGNLLFAGSPWASWVGFASLVPWIIISKIVRKAFDKKTENPNETKFEYQNRTIASFKYLTKFSAMYAVVGAILFAVVATVKHQ